MFSLYVHIPFCARKCLYCDFLSFPAGEEQKERYVEALLSEIEQKAPRYRERTADTVFIGGGTPSILEAGQTVRILRKLKECFRFSENAEISMEANPGTVTGRKLAAWREAGVNRLSLGLQSADDRELKMLGRIHTYAEFLESFALAKEAGYTNINVDLMSALPGQTQESYERTLHAVCALSPGHISAYSLILEEGTPFFDRYSGEGGAGLLPDEDTDRGMYLRTKELLADYGYRRYEISNYARPGFACRHNLSYWKRTDYLGLGLGACSMVNNVRWNNTGDIGVYMDYYGEMPSAEPMQARRLNGLLEENKIRLTVSEQMEEFMFLGLRMTDGVRRQDFLEAFGRGMEEVYGGVLKRLAAQKLLTEKDGRVRLTDYGTDVSNRVFEEFLF